MFLACLRKELLHNILSSRYAVTLILFTCLAIGATAIRTYDYNVRLAAHRQMQPIRQAYVQSAVKQGNFWHHTAGLVEQREPNPLSVFAAGLDAEMSRPVTLHGHLNQSTTGHPLATMGSRVFNNPAFRFGLQLDMVLIVNVVASLLAMLLVYDSICGEREQGTLKVLLSGPVPRDIVVAAKLAAGGVSLVVPLLAAWLLSVLYAIYAGGISFEPSHMVRLAWMILLSGVYVSLFFAVGMVASAWSKLGAVSLGACMVVWVIVVLAVPNLVPLAVAHVVPVPSHGRMLRETDAVVASVTSDERGRITTELADKREFENAGMPMVMWWELIRRLRSDAIAKYEKLRAFQHARLAEQTRVSQQVSRMSPSASFVHAATHCAGTGILDYLRFARDVSVWQNAYYRNRDEQYREGFRIALTDGPAVFEWRFDPAQFPKLESKPVSTGHALQECLLDVVLLIGGTVVLLLLAYIGFMRYDPR